MTTEEVKQTKQKPKNVNQKLLKEKWERKSLYGQNVLCSKVADIVQKLTHHSLPSAGLKVEKRDFSLLHKIDHCQSGRIQQIFWLIELTVNFNFAMNIMLPFIIQSEGVLCSSQMSIKLRIIVWGNVCIGKSHIGMASKQLTTGMNIIQILRFKAIMSSLFGIFLLILC